MTIFPINWVRAPIGSLCDLKNGRAFKPAEWSQDGLPIVRIQNLNKASAPFNRFNGTYDHKHYLKGGELLFAWSGTPGTSFGAHVWRGGEALLNQHIFRVDFDDALLDRRFFRHAINQKLTELIGVAHGGAGLQHVTKGVFEGTEVALPPRTEQKRIADKLDAVLTRVDAVNTRLARVASLLKRFRQSVLAAATSGRLTEDWRATAPQQSAANELAQYLAQRSNKEKKPPAQPDMAHWKMTVPSTWKIASVHQFAECLDRLRVPIKRDQRQSELGLYPYYGANGEVGRIDQFIFDDELVLVTEDETFYGREKPIAYRSSGKCWVNNHAHVLRAPSKAANDYLCFSLMYYDVIPWLSGTTGRAKLTQQALNSLPIAVPPALEISEIVRRVETLFAFADRLEARLETAQTAADRLTPSLLAKAFRGELVPQDPNDEPASELLKRLAASAPASASKRGRAKSSTAA